MKFVGCICLFFLLQYAEASQVVVKGISQNYIGAIESCKKQMDIPEATIMELTNFWREEYKLSERMTGCTIKCLSTKLDLLDPEGNLHHGNAKEFAKKHGADDEIAHKLVDMIHTCEKSVAKDDDECMYILNVAICFKAKVLALDWAPDMDVVLGEVIAEV